MNTNSPSKRHEPVSNIQLREMTLRGIGSYVDGARIQFRPITLICGTNGSGKSTWFRALEAIRRSLGTGRLPFAIVEDFERLQYGHESKTAPDSWIGLTNVNVGRIRHDDMSLSYEQYCNQTEGDLRIVNLAYDDDPQYGPPGTIGLKFSVASFDLHLGFEEHGLDQAESNDSHSVNGNFSRFIGDGYIGVGTDVQIRLSIATPEHQGKPNNYNPFEPNVLKEHLRGVECAFNDSQRIRIRKPPRSATYEVHASRSLVERDADPSSDEIHVGSFELTDRGHIAHFQARDHRYTPHYLERFTRLFVIRCEQLLSELFKGLFYISAIRAPALTVDLTVEPADPGRYVGSSGQHAYLMAYWHAFRLARVVRQDAEDQEITLLNYWNIWLDRFVATHFETWTKGSPDGLRDEVAAMHFPPTAPAVLYVGRLHWDVGEDQIEERVSGPHMWNPLPDRPCCPNILSDGFHQLAPIVVQIGLMKKRECLFIENPEVHLHPGLQLSVMQYLIQEAQIGKCIIVETHSDLLVRRTLRALREDAFVDGDFKGQEAVRIYFTSRERIIHLFENGDKVCFAEQSVITGIELDDRGRVKNWPPGFMSDDLEESQKSLETLAGDEIEEEDEE